MAVRWSTDDTTVMTSNIILNLLILVSWMVYFAEYWYNQSGTEINPTAMSATAKDISSKFVAVRSLLLTRNAPIISELPKMIMAARRQKKTSATIISVVVWGISDGQPRCIPVIGSITFPLVLEFQDEVLFIPNVRRKRGNIKTYSRSSGDF